MVGQPDSRSWVDWQWSWSPIPNGLLKEDRPSEQRSRGFQHTTADRQESQLAWCGWGSLTPVPTPNRTCKFPAAVASKHWCLRISTFPRGSRTR